jgi:Bacitracin resistance protein BacA
VWLLIVATIPAGLTGLLFEHLFRTFFAKPMAAAVFIVINGLILFSAERLRTRPTAKHLGDESEDTRTDRDLAEGGVRGLDDTRGATKTRTEFSLAVPHRIYALRDSVTQQ